MGFNTSVTAIYKEISVNKISMIYQEAGDPASETLIFLNGVPPSSLMYRNIVDAQADRYHIIAPHYSILEFAKRPSLKEHDRRVYDRIAAMYMKKFVDQLGIKHFILVILGDAEEMGLRIAAVQQEMIHAMVILTPPFLVSWRLGTDDPVAATDRSARRNLLLQNLDIVFLPDLHDEMAMKAINKFLSERKCCDKKDL